MKKISIIIPVYNVAPYLKKCLDSILLQTLHDIEVILIDDGSIDESGAICDKYESKDNRVKVFHTKNKGLSAARNLGINNACAQYLMFVDSDDWVEPDFCEVPYHVAKCNNADIVVFMACLEKNNKTLNLNFKSSNIPYGFVDSKIAVNNSGSFVWNKLYKRELFNDIRFPDGKVYEDIATTHKVILNGKRIVILPNVLYHYVQRRDSIGNSRIEKNRRDGFESAFNRFDELRKAGCEDDLSTLLFFTIGYLIVANPSENPIYLKAKMIADGVKSIPKGLNWKRKIMLLVWKINSSLFHFICRMLRQKKIIQKE